MPNKSQGFIRINRKNLKQNIKKIFGLNTRQKIDSPKKQNFKPIDKVKELNDIGVIVSVIEKNDRYQNGYVLGKMKDDYLESKKYAVEK